MPGSHLCDKHNTSEISLLHKCEPGLKEQGWLSNISNTRDSVSSGYLNKKYHAQRIIFDEIRDVWISDETLSRVFYISSQSEEKPRRKRRCKIVKVYAFN